MTLDMPRLAVAFGLVLVVLGPVSYFGSGQTSLTALIPVPFGFALIVLGYVAKRTGSSKHAMHAAAMVALLGVLGSANGIPDAIRLAMGSEVERPLAALVRTVMAADLAIFLGLCVRSFRQARRAMRANEG